MENRIAKLKEVATYLKCTKEIKDLERIEEALSNKQFFLAVFGQFSAGKSRLLNNLLGEEILPVRVTETTAFLTFIKYGVTAGAKLFYTDGQAQEISIERIQALFEGNKLDEVRSFEEIDYIEVYIPSPLLQSGLVLVDTPGVNTLITRHQQLATSVIQASGRIIYVMGKALSDVDRQFIEAIKSANIEITFARTKMDEVKLSEESYEEVIARDKEVLAPFLETSKIYHISNEPSCEKWYGVIKDLYNDLYNNLVSDIEAEIKKNCNNQLDVLAHQLKVLLDNEQVMLKKLLSDEVGNAEEKQLYYSNLIHELEERLDNKAKTYKNQIKQMQSKVENELVDIQEQAYIAGERRIYGIEASSKVDEELARVAKDILVKSGERFSNYYRDALDDLVMEARDEIEMVAQDLHINELVNVEDIMPDSFDELEEDALNEEREMRRIKSEIDESYNKINFINEQVAKMNTELELKASRDELEETLQGLQEALQEYAYYNPQYVPAEDQPVQVSEIMRKVGNLGDLALFFLPGGTIAKGVQGLAKSEKVVKLVTTALGATDKISKGIKKADNIKDTLFVIGKLKDSKIYKTQKRKAKAKQLLENASDKIVGSDAISNILDKFTLAHWFEKAGQAFDQPMKMEIDKQYEQEFFAEKKRLEEQYRELQHREIQQKEELGLIRSEVERQNVIRQVEEKRARELAERLEQRRREIRKESEKKAFNQLQATYLKMLAQEMRQLRLHIIDYYNQKIEEHLEALLIRYNARLIQRINNIREKQNEVVKQLQSGEKEKLEQSISICANYLEEIA